MKQGADSMISDCRSRAPLYEAAFRGFEEICSHLLRYKVDLNCKDTEGTTPLHASVWSGHRRIAEMILEKGADIDLTESLQGNTALHIAAQTKQFDIAALLVKVGKMGDGDPSMICSRIFHTERSTGKCATNRGWEYTSSLEH